MAQTNFRASDMGGEEKKPAKKPAPAPAPKAKTAEEAKPKPPKTETK